MTFHLFLIELIKQFVRGGVIILGFLLAFEILDANTLITSIIGAAGLFGLAIGFAIRDTVENYISSILLGLRQPFNPNDFVMALKFLSIRRCQINAAVKSINDEQHD